MCPGRSRAPVDANGAARIDYAINSYPWNGNQVTVAGNAGTYHAPAKLNLTLVNIIDGTSQTMFVGEKSLPTTVYQNNVAAVGDECAFQTAAGNNRDGTVGYADSPTITNLGTPYWGSPFSGAFPVVLYDGSVRTLTYSIDFTPLITSNKGDIYTGP
jgi:hypothetical protein